MVAPALAQEKVAWKWYWKKSAYLRELITLSTFSN